MRDGFDRSIRAQEEMVAGLLDQLGVDSASFVAHDIGGGVGLRYAVNRSDAVENLVLSNAVCYDSRPAEPVIDLALPGTAKETSVEDGQELVDGLFRGTLTDDADDEFVEGMKAPWESEEGVVSPSRNAVATNTNHTTEIDPEAVAARTLLLWGPNSSSWTTQTTG